MKLPRGISYALYLIAMGITLSLGAVATLRLYPTLSLTLNVSYLINFLDIASLVFLLLVCLLALLCTRSLRPLKAAFVWMFSRREFTAAQCEESLLAVKTTVLAAFAAGLMLFLTSIVNALKSLDLSDGVSRMGAQLSAGLIAPIYALTVAFILLPVYVELKRALSRKNGGAKQAVPIRAKNSKTSA